MSLRYLHKLCSTRSRWQELVLYAMQPSVIQGLCRTKAVPGSAFLPARALCLFRAVQAHCVRIISSLSVAEHHQCNGIGVTLTGVRWYRECHSGKNARVFPALVQPVSNADRPLPDRSLKLLPVLAASSFLRCDSTHCLISSSQSSIRQQGISVGSVAVISCTRAASVEVVAMISASSQPEILSGLHI